MRDYLNIYSEKPDSRPLVTDFDEKTGRPAVVVGEQPAPDAEPAPEAPADAQ